MTDIVIVGEAWGEAEARERTPFVGPSGYCLTQMLKEAGIDRADCYLTNVLNLQPNSRNQIEAVCGSKDEAIPGYPALIKGKYLRKEFQPELERLQDEIASLHPNVVICLGNTALWSLSGLTSISKLRGSTRYSSKLVADIKLLPTYHPAAVLRQWDLRPITVVDLIKAKRESFYPEIRRPKRQIFIPETIEDLYDFKEQYIRGSRGLATDIETSGTAITCIGFAPRIDVSLVIPIIDYRRSDRSYWQSTNLEFQVITFIREILEDESIKKIFQNGMYDIAFILRTWGIKVLGAEHDTMLLHHALQPESLKGLGFLGSIYCDEGSWKQMRERHTTIKRDD